MEISTLQMAADSLQMAADSLSIVADSLATVAQNLPKREIGIDLVGSELVNSLNLGRVIVGIVALFGIFFVPFIAIVSIIWFILSHKRKQDKLRVDLMTKAIESGQPIPENLFETTMKEKKSPIKKGIIWIAVGLGIALFFTFNGIADKDYSDIFEGLGISMIPLFVGLGYLLIHFFDKKEKQKKNGGGQ